ncbi:kelch-like protein 40-like [Plakobranchus ocellatus]|uniref:Kelch-like protein 40-like n=1 Tax=Plakobranchus ocellatus TaxID=259542 RepID=A0AAV4BU33_9GAST|nr:kelch-like protein 40-like [Plakobranchus ocellatus]
MLSLENVYDMFLLSDQFDIQVLFTECKNFLVEHLSVTNCVRAYRLSVMHSCCEDLQKVSWSFLLQHFNAIFSANDFSDLTADDMKSLVSSPDLVSRSEDMIVESILQWARAGNKAECEEIKGEIIISHEQGVVDKHEEHALNKENAPGLDKEDVGTIAKTIRLPDDATEDFKKQTSIDNGSGSPVSDSNDKQDLSSRVRNPAGVLEATKYILISGGCLWETLANDPLIQNDPKGRAIQDKILRYKTQLDCHQDACIPAAMHRNSSQLRNVVLSFSGNMILCLTKDDFSWKYLVSASIIPQNISCLIYYDNNIYIQSHQRMLHVFTTQEGKLYELAGAVQTNGRAITMLPIGNDLISINTSDNINYTVDSHSLQVYKSSAWIPVGELSMRGMEIICVTNIGSKLIIFWKQAGKTCISIECFDLTRLESHILPHQLDSSAHLVAFKHEDEAFVLQQNGALWRMSAQPEPPFITLKHEMWLWTFQRTVRGSLLFDGELLVFETVSSDKREFQPDICLDHVFNGLRFCTTSSPQTRFVHAVLPKFFIGQPVPM